MAPVEELATQVVTKNINLESSDLTKDIFPHATGGELHVVRENARPEESEGGGEMQQGRLWNDIDTFFEEPNCRARLKIHWTSRVFLQSRRHLSPPSLMVQGGQKLVIQASGGKT